MITKEIIEALHAKAAVLRARGKNNTLHDIEQAADYLDAAAAFASMPGPAVKFDRLRAILRELWAACDMDLKMCDGTIKTGQFGTLRDIREDLGLLLSTAAITPAPDLASENERLRAALTPSAETKAAYIGEFSFLRTSTDEHGDERSERITVPWTTVKDIMKAIREYAVLERT